MHIYTDNQGTFWLIFAFYLTSCCNSRMYYRNLECLNQTVSMFNRDQIFRENSFTRNYEILNSTVVNDFQHSKVLMSILLRHNHRKFSDGSRNNYMQAIAGPELAFDLPLFPSHSSHLCCYERSGWGCQNWVCPRARETLGTPLRWQQCILRLEHLCIGVPFPQKRGDDKLWLRFFLQKRSHNLSSPRFCNKVKKTLSLQQWLVSWSSPVVPKVLDETQTKVEKGQKWVAQRRVKLELCIFNVISASLCPSVA